ncbi:uncharacterized protein LODBEIA_P36270 [Lodderomyces beijingensis]|uniref:TUG ubiquitin-like domain-containing protein n=1 Tax=Lodderomyces beijingensis TaxID=1775926 RepID=A0ABP0ZMM0_9ASCO
MATITVNVSYLTKPKKVSISKISPVSQLVSQCLQLYDIDTDYTGELYHNDKKLDTGLPIRLTNLINNSKLVLKVKKADLNKEINVKLITERGQSVGKFKATVLLLQVLDHFKIDPSKPTQLRVLNMTVDFTHYATTTLGTVVGNADSVAMRLENLKSSQEKELINKRQQEAVRLQMQQDKLRREQEEKRNQEKEEEAQAQAKKKKKEQEQDDARKEDEVEQKEQEPVESIEDENMDSASTKDDVEMGVETTEAETGTSTTEETPGSEAESSYVYKEEEFETTPQLYVPSNEPQRAYENPDEDYHTTVHQLKTYQSTIRSSGQRPKKTASSKVPSKYLIRIKFPDGSILQINFLENIAEIKFGQLIKKIDELLLPRFIGNYNLKIGYPPFTKLQQSFALNNELLYKLPDFKAEQVSLIWELSNYDATSSSSFQKGPFLNNGSTDLIIKPSDELPERKLERHRGQLPGDESVKSKKSLLSSTNSTSKDEGKKSSLMSKIPKWMRINK